MKKILFIIFSFFISIESLFAKDSGFFGKGIEDEQLRTGNIHIGDIPNMIRGMIDFLMGLAGTVAVIFIILGAYKILFSGFDGDKSKGKNTIIMAITGFVLASLAWFIIKFIIDNLQRGAMT